jgi:hypothetical protein
MMKALETTGNKHKESFNKITAFANNKAHYLYDTYGMMDKNTIFSQFVFGKISTCVEATHEMYIREGKVLNQLFNHYSQELLISFPSALQNIGMEDQVKLVWLDFKKIVCAVKNGRFYSVVDKEPYFMDCAIICGKHPLNGYCFQVITTTWEGIEEITLFYDAVNKKATSAPTAWVHIIEYCIETKDTGKQTEQVSVLPK